MAETADDFKRYCIKCSTTRDCSSSNAKFDFDYCIKCKQISSFSKFPEPKESLAKKVGE